MDITVKTGRAKLKEEFVRNKHIKDIRVIDMLVIKVRQTNFVSQYFALINCTNIFTSLYTVVARSHSFSVGITL